MNETAGSVGPAGSVRFTFPAPGFIFTLSIFPNGFGGIVPSFRNHRRLKTCSGASAVPNAISAGRVLAKARRTPSAIRRAMLDVCERLDGARPEPDYDAPAELGAWACDEIDRLRAAARREGAEAMREACAEAVTDALSYSELATTPTKRISAAIRGLPLPDAPNTASAYRRGAEAMREAAARRAAEKGRMYAGACTNVGDDIAAAIRALPLPEAP